MNAFEGYVKILLFRFPDFLCERNVCALGVWRSRPAVALTGSTPGCRPPLRMTRWGNSLAKKVRIYAGFTAFFRFRVYAEIPALFFSCKLIKKPSPVGEGGPR